MSLYLFMYIKSSAAFFFPLNILSNLFLKLYYIY